MALHSRVRVSHKQTWLEEQFGPPEAAGGAEKLFEHMPLLCSKAHIAAVKADFAKLRKMGGGIESLVQERVTAMKQRMCDLSDCMQEVKVRFSRWYNRRHSRQGTLWMGKYKSVLVERKFRPVSQGDEWEPEVARLMAAYIDMNYPSFLGFRRMAAHSLDRWRGMAVSEGKALVEGAEDWRWNDWSAALAGDKEVIAGLCDGLDCKVKDWDGWARARDLDEGTRRTLLVKIPEFSRSLVIGEFEEGNGGGRGGDTGRTRRSRVAQVQGVTVRTVVGNAWYTMGPAAGVPGATYDLPSI